MAHPSRPVIANVIPDRVALPDEQRRLSVACGAGAGMAAAYGVPLGDALFSLEVLRGALALRFVLPSLVTAFVATGASWAFLPDMATYVIPLYKSSISTIAWALVVGPIVGLVCVGLHRHGSEDREEWLSGWDQAAGKATYPAPLWPLGGVSNGSAIVRLCSEAVGLFPANCGYCDASPSHSIEGTELAGDWLARSLKDLQDIVHELKERRMALRATEQPINTGTAAGKAFLDMLGVFAEFETNLRKERQAEGIAAAKARGVYKGRKPKINSAVVHKLRDEEKLGPADIARRLGIGRASVYRVLGKKEAA